MPVKIDNVLAWGLDGIADNAVEQAERTSRLPFVDGHLALMPDAHWGMGSTVGSVIPTHGAIIPSAIGVDIGCGMIAAQLPLTSASLPDDLKPLHRAIAKVVPAGVGQGHERNLRLAMSTDLAYTDFSARQDKKLHEQFGTLGSGNHFVEVCLDETDNVWVVLHSGSRGIGNELARIHIDGAKSLMKKYFIELEDPDLAYLVQGTNEFDAYIRDMRWAQNYAMGNREAMMRAVLPAVADFVGMSEDARELQSPTINSHHNYSAQEHHNGKNLWVTRKGAIKAGAGDLGIIPGSMGTETFIVRGLGNSSSYCSASHGAGRTMSRGKAKRELSTDSLREAMAGKVWNESDKLIDEHPDSYKSIRDVMAAQSDLVEIVHTLNQILNFKGEK